MLESNFRSHCVKCGKDRGLDSGKSQMEEIERAYRCPECYNLIVVVGPLCAPGTLGARVIALAIGELTPSHHSMRSSKEKKLV
jgi:DNA-directed RNA polymerase subunit RPC12/RpoP